MSGVKRRHNANSQPPKIQNAGLRPGTPNRQQAKKQRTGNANSQNAGNESGTSMIENTNSQNAGNESGTPRGSPPSRPMNENTNSQNAGLAPATPRGSPPSRPMNENTNSQNAGNASGTPMSENANRRLFSDPSAELEVVSNKFTSDLSPPIPIKTIIVRPVRTTTDNEIRKIYDYIESQTVTPTPPSPLNNNTLRSVIQDMNQRTSFSLITANYLGVNASTLVNNNKLINAFKSMNVILQRNVLERVRR